MSHPALFTDAVRGLPRAVRGAWLALALALALVATGVATAAAVPPRWNLDVLSNSTVRPGGRLVYLITASNRADTPMSGAQYTLTIELPDRVTGEVITPDFGGKLATLSCPRVAGERTIECTGTDRLDPYTSGGVYLTTAVAADAAPLVTARFTIRGGGAAEDGIADTTRISNAEPEFGVEAFDGQVSRADGGPFAQAGGHPYDATVWIDFNAMDDTVHGSGIPFVPGSNLGWPVEAVRNTFVDLPPGLVGNPQAVEECTMAELANSDGLGFPLCSPASQVGMVTIYANGLIVGVDGPRAVYSIAPPPGVPARFGFVVAGATVTLDAALRSDGDYGLSINARDIPAALGVAGTRFTFWGVPASPDHDFERNCAGEAPPSIFNAPCEAGITPKAFLRNPTKCTDPGVGLRTTLRTDSWQDPGDFKEASFISHDPPVRQDLPLGAPRGPEGCDRVPFDPTLRGEPATPKHAGAPAGFQFDLTLPQTDDPTVVATSDLKKAVVTLPEGVRVGPSAAQGLEACSPAQIGLRSMADPTCPGASKVGTLTIDTPLLDEQLEGGIYLATPFDNPFDSLIAIYLVAKGPGLIVKLPGHITTNPTTGQLTATFDDNPQLPFERLHLEFRGGDRAPLVLPKQCGTYTTHAVLTGWNGKTVTSDSSFTLTENARGQPCPSTFTPGFVAGTENPVAGGSSPFHLRMTRDDEDQELQSVKIDMPPGLLGRIADTVLCADAAANAGTCGDGSRLGNVTVGAGAGPNPFYITNGRVHVTEGYKGAPFGLSIVVPAIAGPFNLGTVVVRSALYVDRQTAELSVVSDPLPTILEGIPLDVRDVRVTIDREGFMVNPTSCDGMRFGGKLASTAGTTVDIWNLPGGRFQVGDCARLGLRPRMAIRVGGRNRIQRGRSTPLRTLLRMPAGEANLSKVRVTLPTALNARLTVINDACTREQYDSGSDECEFARTGSAVAVTPLLRDPLRGGVYFVRNGNPLPDLFVRLRGQVDFDLVGRITIPGSKRLRTTFDMVPDVPVSMFALRLEAGRDGSIGNAANLCSSRARRQRAVVSFAGQNGKELTQRKRLRVGGCRSTAGRRARRRGRR